MPTANSPASKEVVTAALLVIGGKILSGRTKDQNIGYSAILQNISPQKLAFARRAVEDMLERVAASIISSYLTRSLGSRFSSLLKKVFEVSRWATLIQDPSARRTKDSQPSGFGFEYCASHVRFRVFQQTASADQKLRAAKRTDAAPDAGPPDPSTHAAHQRDARPLGRT